MSNSLRDIAQELYELGPRGSLFRAGWELRDRCGLLRVGREARTEAHSVPAAWTNRLPFADPLAVADAMRDTIGADAVKRLTATARDALRGRLLCFGRWTADFGDPIDWHLNPRTGRRWVADGMWSPALAADADAGDIKVSWEAARFQHAYYIARAAAFAPRDAEHYARLLAAQMHGFAAANPFGEGVHGSSGQEVAIRLLAWLFALDTLCIRHGAAASTTTVVEKALLAGGRLIAARIDYARIAVRNNHLISEALGLFAIGALMRDSTNARAWAEMGRTILDEEADRQFYRDGGYIQQSHNYHRAVLMQLLWACAFAKAMGSPPSASWLKAMDRSLDFLVAHQNPTDGRLPNYGGNDGAMPGIFSNCDFADFRPVLQTVSLAVRRERIFDRGPWDEMPAWFFGPAILDEPLRRADRKSVAFNTTGYQVLRGADPECFSAFRCGSLVERFSQIDMLHLDVWWRGMNVLVDPGSYQYNAAPRWHEHFIRTASHNTVVVDGRDQMLHRRQFKVLYWTKAQLLAFEDHPTWALCSGEHYGYRRHTGACVHRRSVLFVKDDLWIVIDCVVGEGEHDVRLHWLGGEFPWAHDGATLKLDTPRGKFSVAAFDVNGTPAASTVVAGADDPPRGWMSRYYGEKVAVPSYVVERRGAVPQTLVTILSGVDYTASVAGAQWTIATADRTVAFVPNAGLVDAIRVS
jgi:hypothetical protein